MARVRGTGGPASRSEADDATRGSAVKLVAEVSSRLLLAAVPFLLLRGLGAPDFGRYTQLSVYALLVAELGELGLQNLASRALVAATHTLRSLVRARGRLLALVALVALAAARLLPGVDAVALAFLVAWFVLSGWAEFLGVALRCRGGRRKEALLLLVLRAGGLAAAAIALVAGGGLRGATLGLAVSPLPALALGALLLRARPEPPGPVERAPLDVLRESAPLGAHGALLLLSPRVEFLVLSWLAAPAASGLFAAAMLVIWPLAMVPTAVVAGAMPALTREAIRGGGAVRRRTAATLAVLAAPAAVGLAQVARPLVGLLLGGGYPAGDYEAAASLLRLLSLSIPAAFLNALVAGGLIASGRAGWLPRLTAGRVALAFALAFLLVPRLGAPGAALGLALAEWSLLAAGLAACRTAGFDVRALAPIAWGLVACLPMALAVAGAGAGLAAGLAMGVLTWAATLAAAWRLAPGLVRRVMGDVRYP
jgi:O-antigen/teichoic acid export membrane protein